VNIAKKLIDVAKDAGADAVKFQTFYAEKCISVFSPKAKYQKQTTSKNESQFDMIKRLELNEEAHCQLLNYCKKKRIMFLSSPFDLESVELLKQLGLKIFKIASGEITNLFLLKKIGSLRKKIILSTGMATVKEIKDALRILVEAGTPKKNIILLHCNTEYPTPIKDVNLLAMTTLRKIFGVKVGYSDHTLGIEVPIAAVALGASVVEKHFTLNRNMKGPDHKSSLEPAELKEMIQKIRNIEKALGSGIKKPSASELKNKTIARKSIVTTRHIRRGEILSEENLTVKRPGSGISPMCWHDVIGRRAKRDFKEDELLEL
jgi:N,N'-diacetyllegionaminate synthase